MAENVEQVEGLQICKPLTEKSIARDRLWQSIRALRSFTVIDLAADASTSHRNAWRYLSEFRRAGFVRVARRGAKGRRAVFALAMDARATAPGEETGRTVTARARLWRSARILQTFTIADLTVTADAGHRNARRYLRALRKAGIVRVIRRGVRGSRGMYALANDIGPMAPRRHRNGSLAEAFRSGGHE